MLASLAAMVLLTQAACDEPVAVVDSEEDRHGLVFDVEEATLQVGDSLDLRVFATDEDGNPERAVRLSDVDWGSTDPDVARVEPGLATAVGPGEATVTAEDEQGHQATAHLHVEPSGDGEDDDGEEDGDGDRSGDDPSFDDAVFVEDWSSGDFRHWDDGPSRSEWRIVHDPALAYLGERVLEVTIPAGENGGYLGAFDAPGHEEMYVRARVRLAEGWRGMVRFFNVRASDPDHPDWPWQAVGGAGQCPRGDDRVRIGFVGWYGSPEPELRWYNYWHGMWPEPDGSTCWGRSSPDQGDPDATYTPLPARLPIGEWFTLEMHVGLNEPGKADGFARMWVDGELRSDWRDESWRTTEALLFNVFQLDLRADADVTRRIYFDDIVVLEGHPGGD